MIIKEKKKTHKKTHLDTRPEEFLANVRGEGKTTDWQIPKHMGGCGGVCDVVDVDGRKIVDEAL